MAGNEEKLTISQIYSKGREKFIEIGYKRIFPPDSAAGATVQANRRYLDSTFFKTQFLNPVKVDTSIDLFGVKLKTPVFCSPMSGFNQLSDTALTDIANGVKNAGSLLMLGIGGSNELQSAIDTGVPVAKIIKPYKNTDLIYEKLRDAQSRGCVAVGMDIDHFYGVLRDDKVAMTDTFGPQSSETLQQLISSTKLPFIIKGVLSVEDAKEAARIGAAAIIVSSHGTSSVDFAIPPIIALPDIVKSVGDKVMVLVDTGFKTGSDVLKSLALGAKAVGFASSILLAWGAGGSREVENLINQITAELRRSMAATGCSNLSAINRSAIIELALMRE
jgi:isopentenyl diphosphate isomerase/L-lactate dehydrogenase-like FMN-dependent dehydrogenase